MAGRGDGTAGAEPALTKSGRHDAGRYRLVATLGRGGMAEVFLAVAHGLGGFNKLVVLKRLRPHLADEAEFRDMFLDEARLAARLNHPNVVQSYEVGEGHGSYFIAMEYLEGQPLNRVIDELRVRGRRLDARLAAKIVSEACAGLQHAHDLRDYDGTPLRIIHRDVSPHNVFVNYDGQVKLVDFGIAKAVNSRADTEVGVLKGKIAYMAPEQAAGEAIDARADLFAMGIVLWELCTGRALFGGENAANTLHKLMSEPIPRPSSVASRVDPKLEAITMRLLERDPGDRFQSARELRAALEGWLRDAGGDVRGEEVGALVTSLFEGVRANVQAEIKKEMAAVAQGGAGRGVSLASIGQEDRSGDDHKPLLDLGPQATGVASGMSRRLPTPLLPASEAPPAVASSSHPRRRRVVVMVLLAGLVAAVGIFLLVRPSAPPRSDLTATIPATPTPTPTSTPTATPTLPSPPVATAVPVESPAPRRASAPRLTHAAGHSSRPPVPTPPAATPDSAPGFLTLDTYPWTRVSEGGRPLGTTPLVHLSLSPGTHTLDLENPDKGLHQSYQVTIVSGAALTRRLGLE
jgi:serine/threonine-protein kinase